MAAVGVISRDPPLTLQEWLEHIDRDDVLVREAPRVINNPFKPGETYLHEPEPGDVSINVAGEPVGAIAPSQLFDLDAELVVCSPDHRRDDCRHVAARIAASLGGELIWFDDELPDRA